MHKRWFCDTHRQERTTQCITHEPLCTWLKARPVWASSKPSTGKGQAVATQAMMRTSYLVLLQNSWRNGVYLTRNVSRWSALVSYLSIIHGMTQKPMNTNNASIQHLSKWRKTCAKRLAAKGMPLIYPFDAGAPSSEGWLPPASRQRPA